MSKIGIQTRGSGAVMRRYLRGGGLAKRGTGVALKTGGRASLRFGSGRTNLLEELGRVEGERSNPNRRAEISRVHGELNKGYLIGGVVKKAIKKLRPAGPFKPKKKAFKTHGKDVPTMAAEGGRIGLKHGGKPWGTGPKPGTHDYLMQQLHKPRKKKAVGGAVKIGKRFLDFIKTGKHVDKSGVKVNVPKAAERLTGKPHVDHGKRKKIKHLGKGKATGGRIGKAAGGSMDPKHHKPKPPRLPRFPDHWKPRQWSRRPEKSFIEQAGGSEKAKPHSTKEGRIASGTRRIKRLLAGKGRSNPGPQAPSRPGPYIPDPRRKLPKPGERKTVPDPRRKPGEKKEYQPAAKGGRMGFKKGGSDKNWIQKAVNPKHKGFCTPMTKKTCTPRRKALARTFKKMGRERKAKG